VEQASQEELYGATHRVRLGSELVKINSDAAVDTTPDAAVDTVDEGNEPNDLTCSRIN
jgi:hypothetical protein